MLDLKKKAKLKVKHLEFKEWLKTHCSSCKREFSSYLRPAEGFSSAESPNGRYIRSKRCLKCWKIEETCADCKSEFSIRNPGTSWPYPKWGSPGRLCYNCKS